MARPVRAGHLESDLVCFSPQGQEDAVQPHSIDKD